MRETALLEVKLNKKVLVVEDDDSMRSVLEDFISVCGFEVVAVSDGALAWELWNQDDFKIVISDINMPILSGIELLKRIKYVNPVFPVILITGVSISSAKKEAEKYNVDEFFSKPFSMKALVSKINELTQHE